MKLRISNDDLRRSPAEMPGAAAHSSIEVRCSNSSRGFTLIELILVLALLVVITSLVAPSMANFIRGRAIHSEARRLFALTHAGQNRAVSEGFATILWIDEKEGTYGLESEGTGTTQQNAQQTDVKAESLTLDENVRIEVLNTSASQPFMIRNLPAIRFLPDGTLDEKSPKTLKLTGYGDVSLWLNALQNRTGYEISDTPN